MLNDAPSSSPTPWVFAPNIMSLHLIAAIALAAMPAGRGLAADAWRVDTPIVSYWAGPGYTNGGDLTDAAAKQLAEGGWNLMWCREKELDIAQRHGLRGLLTADTFTHTSLHHADKHAELDGVIERVRKHPAFYACHLSDEPPAEHFPGFAHIVGYLREREFAAIAKELQPLKSQGVFHAGMQPPDITPLLPDSAFTFGPPIAPAHRTRPSHPPIAPAHRTRRLQTRRTRRGRGAQPLRIGRKNDASFRGESRLQNRARRHPRRTRRAGNLRRHHRPMAVHQRLARGTPPARRRQETAACGGSAVTPARCAGELGRGELHGIKPQPMRPFIVILLLALSHRTAGTGTPHRSARIPEAEVSTR